jgi:hypothetical protein
VSARFDGVPWIENNKKQIFPFAAGGKMNNIKMIRQTGVSLAIVSAMLFGASPVSAKTVSAGCDMIEEDGRTMVMQENINLRNVSWAEVILWCGNGGTFNTMSLNDPKDSAPEAFFKKLDKTAFAEKYQVTAVSTNPDEGRKFWTCDEFHIEGSTVVRDFNGLKARYVGTVQAKPDGSPQSLSAADIPKFMYKTNQFNRVSTLVFKKDRPVFLLDDPAGTTWVIKAYSTNVDKTLTYDALTTLDTRLKHLPEGWKFRSVVIDQDLIIKADGAQRIMWDELGNAYDALEPGSVNFKP